MAALDPAVAAIRAAVRRAVLGLPDAGRGRRWSPVPAGPTRWRWPRPPRSSRPGRSPAGLVTVDHELQAGSAERAERGRRLGRRAAASTRSWSSTVDVAGRPGGPEAAARDARYEALVARGQRARRAAPSCSGTPATTRPRPCCWRWSAGPGRAAWPACRHAGAVDGVALLRPLLDVGRGRRPGPPARRSDLPVWDDPHNADPAYRPHPRPGACWRRWSDSLGPAVVGNLARTARWPRPTPPRSTSWPRRPRWPTADPTAALRGGRLAGLPAAVRTRVLHAWARRLGRARVGAVAPARRRRWTRW